MKQNRRRKWWYGRSELAALKGISVQSVSADIRREKFDPGDLGDVVRWLGAERVRKSKGRAMPWLEGKRGRKKKVHGLTVRYG